MDFRRLSLKPILFDRVHLLGAWIVLDDLTPDHSRTFIGAASR